MLPFAFNISTSRMNEMQFFIHWQKEKDWQSRETCSESNLANKATERARQLEVRSEINGSFKDVVVAAAVLCCYVVPRLRESHARQSSSMMIMIPTRLHRATTAQ